MPTTTSWLYWHCTNLLEQADGSKKKCGQRNRGDKKECTACGHPIGHEERMAMEATVGQPQLPEDIITDQETLDLVEGPGKADHWCNVCDRSVEWWKDECPLCGAPEDATFEDLCNLMTFNGVKWSRDMDGETRVLLAEQYGPFIGRELMEGRDATGTSGLDDALDAFGVDRHGESIEDESVDIGSMSGLRNFRPRNLFQVVREFFSDLTPRKIWICMGVLGFIGFIWLMIWGFTTHEVPGKVTALTWERTEYVERFERVRDSDWEHNINESHPIMPVNGSGERAGAQIISCSRRHYEDEEYQCGTQTEQRSRQVADGQDCHTETTPRTCTTNGNGSQTCSGGDSKQVCTPRYRTENYPVEVPKYCTRPIYKQYCDYWTFKWRHQRQETTSGTGHEMYWADLMPGSLERVRRTEQYDVHVMWKEDGTDKRDKISVSLGQYESWDDDEDVIVHVRNFGGAARIERRTASN